ncbi:hypothetical protein E4U21_004095 [Claviceps maximensis]|nr:hypothetical protein E4U21_004095 [Claviceps maximensis]
MLNIVIVRAGIAGLSAATSLRRAGHGVHVYEKSSMNSEIGAAITIPPNAARFLLAWGLDPVRWRWVRSRRVDRLDPSTLEPILHVSDEQSMTSIGGLPSWHAHRFDLHSALKWMATREDGPGTPAVIHLKSAAKAYIITLNSASDMSLLQDPSKPSIILDNGEEVHGDLVIAADGVHSAGPEAILGRTNDPVPAFLANCCYRFLIPVHNLQQDPDTKFFVEDHHGWSRVLPDWDEGRRMIVYPCSDNTIINFVGLLHEEEPEENGTTQRENWHETVDVTHVVEKFTGYDPRLLKVISKATDVRRWRLLYRHPLPTWNKGRMTLIGDAAHPILPHLAQGGAQALEDSLALGIILTGVSSPDEIENRLALYCDLRRKRASAVQILSNIGPDHASVGGEELLQYMSQEEIPKDMRSTQRYCLAFDVVQNTVDVMREYDPLFRLADDFFEKPVIGLPGGNA